MPNPHNSTTNKDYIRKHLRGFSSPRWLRDLPIPKRQNYLIQHLDGALFYKDKNGIIKAPRQTQIMGCCGLGGFHHIHIIPARPNISDKALTKLCRDAAPRLVKAMRKGIVIVVDVVAPREYNKDSSGVLGSCDTRLFCELAGLHTTGETVQNPNSRNHIQLWYAYHSKPKWNVNYEK